MKPPFNVQHDRGQAELTAAANTVCANIGQWYQMAGVFTDTYNRGFTTAAGGTVTYNGPDGRIFLFNGASDLQVDKASTITYALYVNGALVTDAQTPHTFTAASKIDNISITRMVELNNGDAMTIRMMSDTLATTVTVNTLFITFWGEM